jgi:lipopolysaccharide assembly protein A
MTNFMKQINFTIIFLLCLALVIFSVENTTVVKLTIIGGVEIKAPISVELILAMGLGAVLAWLFSAWSRLQRFFAARQQQREIEQKNQRIQDLEQQLAIYQTEETAPTPQLPASNSPLTETETLTQ